MCISPRKIQNKKLSFNSVVDRVYNIVPCGHCIECADRIRNDYVCRSIAQHLENKSFGGCTLFVTLTFDETHVPRFNGKRCFRVSIVQNFFKRLRKRLEGSSGEFSYILSSEFGSKNTCRPHHHVLFFIRGIDYRLFKKYVSDSWQQGWICFGKNNGVVQSVHALNYTCKYLSKDYGLQNLYSSEEYQDVEKDYTFNNFHLQSIGFGKYLDTFISRDSLIHGKVDLPSFSNKKGDVVYKTYTLPIYSERRFLYERYKNINGTVSYRLNHRGCYIMDLRKKAELSEFVLHYKKFLNDFERFQFPFEKDNSFLKDVYDLCKSTDPFDLFVYRSFRRNGSSDYFSFKSLDSIKKFYDLKYKSSFIEYKSNDAISSTHLRHDVYTDMEYELILYFYDYFQRFWYYQDYEKRCLNYNSLQNYRILTGVYKPKIIDGKKVIEFKYQEQLNFDDYMLHFDYYDSLKHSLLGSRYAA